MRSGALNKVTNHSPLLDDDQAAVPFSIFNSTGVTNHRMVIYTYSMNIVQIVSGDPMHPDIIHRQDDSGNDSSIVGLNGSRFPD